jgi:hypothetical protein
MVSTIKFEGEYSLKAYINLFLFKVAYTRKGRAAAKQTVTIPVEGRHVVSVQGPFDAFVEVTHGGVVGERFVEVGLTLDGGLGSLISRKFKLPLGSQIVKLPVSISSWGNTLKGDLTFEIA